MPFRLRLASRPELRRLLASSLFLGLCLVNLGGTANSQQKLIRQTPRTVVEGHAKLVAPYDPDQKLRLVLGLRPPHLEQEEEFLHQLQDRNSPLFHKYLTQEQWNRRFAPAVEDERAVVEWAQRQGLTVTHRYANRLLVDLEAPVGTIQTAFEITINHYDSPEDGSFFSNDREPIIPAHLAGVVQLVSGLNSLDRATHAPSRRPEGASPNHVSPDYVAGPSVATGPSVQHDGSWSQLLHSIDFFNGGGGYSPGGILGYYGYDAYPLGKFGHCCNPLNNSTGAPPEASVAIAIWGQFDSNDINGYIDYYWYLAANIQSFYIDGTPACCDSEPTLDTEWATTTSNSYGPAATTGKVYVYQGVDNRTATILDVLNQALNDGYARVLSMSWGLNKGEAWYVQNAPSVLDQHHAIFSQMVGQGWTLVAASGDQGPTTGCGNYFSVSYPASDPYVTAVGGTTLHMGYDNNESTWTGGTFGCSNNDGGSGGGCSAYYNWPSNEGPTNNACAHNGRSVPDIALNSDWAITPQSLFYQGSFSPDGGTSVAAPEMAGFFAQENAYLLYLGSLVGNTCGGNLNAPCAPLGNANPALYLEGNAPYAPHSPFYDTLTGCNNNDITLEFTLPYNCAAPGYDMATGWGSVNMFQLAWALNAYMAGDGGAPTVTMTGPAINHWFNTDQTISWTITDTTANGHVANGVAGITAQWDIDIGDPYSEPQPMAYGYYNNFYVGPITATSTTGSLDFLASGSQGCHTLNYRAWDNAGQSSGLQTYGPICVDTLPPNTWAYLQGDSVQNDIFVTPVVVSFYGNDWVSGMASISYQVDYGNWQTYSYPLWITQPGDHVLNYYGTDVAGNVETTQTQPFTIVGQTLALSISGSGTVASTDGTIVCPGNCTGAFLTNTQVTMVATPANGWSVSWTGCDSVQNNNCIVTMTAYRAITATFTAGSFPLTVTVDGGGIVTSADGSINCPGVCSHTYTASSRVSLVANATQGWRFAGWIGCPAPVGNVCQWTITRTAGITAAFNPGQVVLSSLTFNPPVVVGSHNSTGTVTLTTAAPPGGVTVNLLPTVRGMVHVPATVLVPFAQTSVRFTARPGRVQAETPVPIVAYAGNNFIAGTVTLAPSSLELSSRNLAFGQVTINTSSSLSLLVYNNSARTMTLDKSIIPQSSPFTIGTNGTCGQHLAAYSNCILNIVFSPVIVGQESATLTVSSGSYSAMATLTGSGQ